MITTIKYQKYDYRKERDEYYLHEVKAGGQLEVKEKCTIPIQMTKLECKRFLEYLHNKQFLLDFEHDFATFISMYLLTDAVEFINHHNSKNRFFYDINGIFHIYFDDYYLSIRAYKRFFKILKRAYNIISNRKSLKKEILKKYSYKDKDGVYHFNFQSIQEDKDKYEAFIHRNIGVDYSTLLNNIICYLLDLNKNDYITKFSGKNNMFFTFDKITFKTVATANTGFLFYQICKEWCEHTNKLLDIKIKEKKFPEKIEDLGEEVDITKENINQKILKKLMQLILQQEDKNE